MDQREMALLEQRNRIINAARSVFTLRYELSNGIDCQITVENKRSEELNFVSIAQAFEGYIKTVDSAAKTFEQLSDEIYIEIAKLYSERDIEVQIINNNSNTAFTKEYLTHKPYQSLAI